MVKAKRLDQKVASRSKPSSNVDDKVIEETARRQQQADNDNDNHDSDSDSSKAAETAVVATNSTAIDNGDNADDDSDEPSELKIYKSTRLKGYITLVFASIINFDAAQKSKNVKAAGAVPSTVEQRRYAIAVAVVSLVLSGATVIMHLDRLTPLTKVYTRIFQPKSKIELGLILFFCVWWSVAVGVETSVQGIAGDGKGQDSLYYSCWGCCLASYWMLERWWVAAGYASLKSFITSWPYRAPGWILILFLSLGTFLWYLDLWTNHDRLRGSERAQVVYGHFQEVVEGQWTWLIIIAVFTVIPALVFVVVELFRETKDDGSNKEKGQVEIVLEGFCLLLLVLSWIPSVMVATTPGGAASLIGNAYFFTWMLVIFILETFVWFVHDLRKGLHQALKEKAIEYQDKQKEVLRKTRDLQRRMDFENDVPDDNDTEREEDRVPVRKNTDYYDAEDGEM
jgi:uncharacterized membrane protein